MSFGKYDLNGQQPFDIADSHNNPIINQFVTQNREVLSKFGDV